MNLKGLNNISSLISLTAFFIFSLCLSGCYSFSSGGIPIHLKSIFIPMFIDKTSSSFPLIKEQLTEFVINKVQSETPLAIIQYPSADSKLEGNIISITDVPGQLDPTTERATKNKVTISVKVVFFDNVKRKQLYSENISSSQEYTVNNLDERTTVLTQTLTTIAQSIVDKMSSNW